MSWFGRLIETYDNCTGTTYPGSVPLPPISHFEPQAHVEIVINGKGEFRRACVLDKEPTLIPATEGSAGRTSTAVRPHPLCDKIQYVAADYPDFGGARPSHYEAYEQQLAEWVKSSRCHPKAAAILSYVRKRSVVRDLVDYGVLLVDGDGRLATKRPEDQKTRRTPIFSVLTPAPETKEYDQANALVRWLVEIPGDTAATFTSTRWNKSTKTKTFTLGDKSLQDAWVSHVADGMGDGTDLCMAEGRKTSVSSTHMKAIRKSGDGAKLISSNDTKGFSFRGRFIDAAQASTIGYVASQKAHIALKWLIQRQGYATDDQQVVAWSIRGFDVPDPMRSLLDDDDFVPAATCDLGEFFANKLKLKMAGYLAKLPPSDRIALIVLDSAVPGRLAVRMYRDYGIEEYIGRLEKWHAEFAWPRKFFVSNNDAANPQKGRFVTAPAAPTPLEVAKAAYGHDIGVKDKKLCRLTVERMTPCIVDAAPVPRDLVVAAFNRAVHRSGQDEIAWENTLATACSLHRGRVAQTTGEIIDMSLDLDRNSRDYLYGRLLAYGEKIELVSQGIAKEKRETNVAKLFSRFAAHPAETWQQIEALLMPYKARVRGKYDGFLEGFESEIDKIFSAFQGDDFARDQKLGPEYLLGYHCQRQALAYKKT